MSGLVQDYSKSPIKPKKDSIVPTTRQDAAPIPNALDQTFVPAALGPQPNLYRPADVAPQYHPTPHQPVLDFGAPPRKSFETRTTSETSRQTTPQTNAAPFSPTTPYYQQNTQQSFPQPQGIEHAGPAGYRQNPIHDGGSTDYSSADGPSGLEYAEQAWSSASKTVGEFAGTAGETVGKAWTSGLGSVKGWLNPESKGMR